MRRYMKVVLKIRRKGVIILPKKLREALGVKEGDLVTAETVDGSLIVKVLKPKAVDVDPKLVEELLREEYVLEESKYEEMMSSGEAGS